MALVDWLLSLGTRGAAANARQAFDRRQAERDVVDALVGRLNGEPAHQQPAA